VIKNKFKNSKLILAQTDSLALAIKEPGKTFLTDLWALIAYFDFSNLLLSHFLYSTQNQGKQGKWKVVDLNIIEMISCRLQ